VIAFDIYGTLVDTAGIGAQLAGAFGPRAAAAAQLWRDKQLEYTFRRALMRRYVDFDTVTAHALQYVSAQLSVPLSWADQQSLLAAYLRLPAFADVRPALEALAGTGHTLVALTNGTEQSVHALLQHAALRELFTAILTVEPLRTFKPDPSVYASLQHRTHVSLAQTCLVSGNPFDVIGAKACGLIVAWLQRDASRVYDPWEFLPDMVLGTLAELPAGLTRVGFCAGSKTAHSIS
jgi:2-haloacid dehalogenase